jgi:putative ABC transport system substrate-binding protein
MRRREFIALLGGAAASRAARAQKPDKVYRIAFVSPTRPVSQMVETNLDYGIFFKELRRLGYIEGKIEGKNLVALRFSAEGDTARYDPIISDVMSAAPDVIFTAGNPLVLRFKALVHSIPVVALMDDPLTNGVVASLARPDGNITGVSGSAGGDVWGKRFAMLLEAVPTATRVGFLGPEPSWDGRTGAMLREAARQSSIMLIAPPLQGVQEPEYRRVFDVLKREHVQALLVSAGLENSLNRHLIVEMAERDQLPAIYPNREYVDIGGLMAYVSDGEYLSRRAIEYVDMILKGKKPGDLPIYQADKFTTIVNLKTAKTLGLTIPPTLLLRADEVIE